MKRPVKPPSGIAAVLLSATLATGLASFAAAPALAGSDIVKCVDADGRVTLTDQPCEGGAATVKLSNEAPAAARGETQSQQQQQQQQPQPQLRHAVARMELRPELWRRPAEPRPSTLPRDIATLKEARRMLMLQETRPRLAGLN